MEEWEMWGFQIQRERTELWGLSYKPTAVQNIIGKRADKEDLLVAALFKQGHYHDVVHHDGGTRM
jgi:hypothetical protein